MGIIATAVKHLIEAGVTGEALVNAVSDMESAISQKDKEIAEQRRAKDRERKQKQRSTMSQDSADNCDKKKKEPKKKNNNINILLPPYIPPELWEEFEQMRRDRKKPLTERTANGVLSKIETLKQSGFDPPALLRTAIDNEWLTVYAPKENHEITGRNSAKLTEHDQAELAKHQALRELGVEGYCG